MSRHEKRGGENCEWAKSSARHKKAWWNDDVSSVSEKRKLFKKWKQEHKQGMLLKDKESEGHIERLG